MMPYCLLPLDGGLPVVLDAPRLTLGRHPGCDRVIRHDTVSRRHCRIAQRGHYLAIRDLSSANGVRVNGRKIEEDTSIAPGDRLRLGSAEFVLAMQSDEVLAIVRARTTEPALVDELSMTQPVSLLRVEEHERESIRKRTPLPKQDISPKQNVDSSPTSIEKESHAADDEPPAREGFTDQSWDMIVALSHRGETVPDPAREPPSEEIRSLLEDDEVDRREEHAVALGYASRGPAGGQWNHVRIGLSLMRWGGLAASLALLFLWVVPTVSVFVMAARIATSVFSPFDTGVNAGPGDAATYGTLMLAALATPIVVCVVLRNVSEDGFWPAIILCVLGVLVGQLIRLEQRTTLVWLAGICAVGIGCGLFVMLVGQCLAGFLPRRIPLAAKGIGGAVALVLAMMMIPLLFAGPTSSIPSLALPIGRPAFGFVVYVAMVIAAAGLVLMLLYLGGVARLIRDVPLCEAADFCLGWTAVSSVLALGVWFAVAGNHVPRGWSDMLLLGAAAGITVSMAWTAQLAGYVRFALR